MELLKIGLSEKVLSQTSQKVLVRRHVWTASGSTQKSTLLVVLLVTSLTTAMTAQTAYAQLSPGDRYQSGYEHGFADQKAGQPNFCSSDHTKQYCDGYDQGWTDAQAGHYPDWKNDDDN